MKAAVFTGPYEFKICDREKPKPGPKEVLIRIRAVGICGSDIHPYMGSMMRHARCAGKDFHICAIIHF